ncbi:glycerophosphodiester phosphodiesterase family protein [Oceanicaulis alexandrii]|uniref:glycerophosphodiester phosphodiesterase family protein n=1 Tax=Oceanicaulis alexandrii TaxID=153233 RepID=UPI0003B4BAB0|nr:glycerophosphodiester phosphodiesterase family protein [Oceanicaulis alexandrii]
MRFLFGVSLFALAACSAQAPAPEQAAEPATPSELNAAHAETAAADLWLTGVDLPAYLDCAREQGVTLLQAHRTGDRPGAAENSIGAMQASLDDGALFMEMDVAKTADGVLILMHDDTVDRTTNGTGVVTEMTYAEISELQLVDVDGQVLDENVPTFADALSFLDGRGFAQVDLKDTSFEEISETLVAASAVDRSIVITYSIEDAILLANLLPDVVLSVGARDAEDLERLEQGDVNFDLATIWLGVGTGNPEWDAELAHLGIETSFGDFGGERNGTVDYQLLSRNGAEVISVDDVPAAAAALNADEASRALLEACPAAQG